MRRGSDIQKRGLKAAFRRLVAHDGGEANAAEDTRVSQSRISHYGNAQRPEDFPPADVILDLELAVGQPVVTRELARLQGHVLIELPGVDGDPAWVQRLGAAAKETGEAIAAIGIALADDGEVTPQEIERLRLLSEVDDAIEALTCIRQAIVAQAKMSAS